jgi:hypothetical protein
MIVLGAVASVGHGGAVLIHPLWACVMAMLSTHSAVLFSLIAMCRREAATA